VLRIGIVIYGSPDQLSGGYLYDRMLARTLQASGHQVNFLSLKSGAYITRPASGAAKSLERQIQAAGTLDIVIIDELCHPSVALGLRRLKQRLGDRPKFALLVHHLKRNEQVPPVVKPLITALEKRLIAGSDGLIVNSTSTLSEVKKIQGVHLPVAVARPSGKRFPEKPRAEQIGPPPTHNEFRILFVGNITPRKGLHSLVEALAAIVHAEDQSVSVTTARHATITAVGATDVDRRYVANLHRRIGRLGIADRVQFTGAVSDSTLGALYENHDILCVPSQFEGFGIVYLEAMGFGMPAIGSLGGGASDIIQDGENGFLVASGDTRALAERITRLRNDPQLCTRMSEAAATTYKTSPTWDESMGTIERFLIELSLIP
jgi:glycosyltransferase involved in cell wall biosynthesis